MGCATAGALVAVPVGRAAGAASVMLALASLGSVVTSVQSLFPSLSPLLPECHELVGATTCVALLSLCWALGRRIRNSHSCCKGCRVRW